MNKNTCTIHEVRQHLMNDEDWTAEEFAEFQQWLTLSEVRTLADWDEAIVTFQALTAQQTKRKTLTITLDLESAALGGDWGDHEAKEILQAAAERVHRLHAAAEWQTDEEPIPLRDSNGVRVGQITVTEVAR